MNLFVIKWRLNLLIPLLNCKWMNETCKQDVIQPQQITCLLNEKLRTWNNVLAVGEIKQSDPFLLAPDFETKNCFMRELFKAVFRIPAKKNRSTRSSFQNKSITSITREHALEYFCLLFCVGVMTVRQDHGIVRNSALCPVSQATEGVDVYSHVAQLASPLCLTWKDVTWIYTGWQLFARIVCDWFASEIADIVFAWTNR